MRVGKFPVFGILILLGVALCAAAQQQNQEECSLGLKDERLVAKLASPISTKGSRADDAFAAQVITPGDYQNAILEGRIKEVKVARRRNKARISFAFEKMTVGNRTCLIRADLTDVANSKGVKGVDEEGHVIGVTSKKKKIAGGLAGAGVGAIIGAIAGGGRGAAIGGAAGAASGFLIAVALTTSGANVEFAPGSELTIVVSDRGGR